ncbi:glycoside hydrolase family 5 protein [Oxalobacteraceae bacterium CAVE-383]|nr:glycoside hydrolase family 5 protein [Oxalobacteraceae bacterium CAVE-383]
MNRISFVSGALLFLMLACFSSPPAAAGCLDGKPLVGVNLAGAEFASEKLPGTIFKDYVYPDPADMRHFRELGMNTFRLPFLWERVQPQLSGELDAGEVKRIADTVAAATAMDACVILDVHNFGQYRGQPIGSPEVPREAFVDLWLRLLAAFPDRAHVAFGLMNEPAHMTVADWAATAQQTLSALRKKENAKGKSASHLVLVPGGGWSGAHSWQGKDRGGVANAEAFRAVRDPADNYLIEVHQYGDSNFSGTQTECIDPARLRKVMADMTQWAKASNQRLFLGEFGVAANDRCLQVLKEIIDGAGDRTAWGGWTYWAAGKWLGTYPFSIQPEAGGDKPQMAILKSGMGRPAPLSTASSAAGVQ